MVIADDEPGREAVDPVYEALFRPEDVAAATPEEAPGAEPGSEPEPVPVAPLDAPPPSPVADAQAVVDTGRLFRSQGVTANDVAVLALASDHGGRLRTLVREQVAPAPGPATGANVDAASGALIADDAGVLDDAPVKESRRDRRRRSAAAPVHRASGISAGAVYLIVIGMTVAVAFVNAWLGGGELGWPTGLALLVSSVYCALRVRRDDDVVAIMIPPIAFFVAAITAGQLFRGASAGGALNRAQLVFFTMAYNWYWVIGTTVVVVVIVLVRRRR